MEVNRDNHKVITPSGKSMVLSDQQEEAIELLMTTNWKKTEIARHMGVDVAWLYRTYRKQHVKDVINQRVQDQILDGAVSAIKKVTELVDHRSGYVALEASKDLLDRAGYKPPDRSQVAVGGEVSIKIDLGG